MSSKISFHWYIGDGLARQLPYRKKGLFSNSLVCEWGAVCYMAKAGFFFGCSLPLASKNATDEVLKDASSPKEWTIALAEVISNIHSRVKLLNPSNTFIAFEMIFPETKNITNPNQLMLPADCGIAIGQRALYGLVFGYLYPEIAEKMLDYWTTQKEGYKSIGIGGMKVNQSPLFSGIEQAKELVLSTYNGWLKS